MTSLAVEFGVFPKCPDSIASKPELHDTTDRGNHNDFDDAVG